MAGATVATWVKVKTKSGLTSRPISHKYENGASYAPGQAITQSEYNEIKANRSEKVSTMKERAIATTENSTPPNKKQSRGLSQKDFMKGLASESDAQLATKKTSKKTAKKQSTLKSVLTPPSKPSRTPKTSLSKQEKTQILLRNKKELRARYEANGQSDQVARLTRLQKADNTRRKEERNLNRILSHGSALSSYLNSSDAGSKLHKDIVAMQKRQEKESLRKAMVEKARKGR